MYDETLNKLREQYNESQCQVYNFISLNSIIRIIFYKY
jgi:hypothetical protein